MPPNDIKIAEKINHEQAANYFINPEPQPMFENKQYMDFLHNGYHFQQA